MPRARARQLLALSSLVDVLLVTQEIAGGLAVDLERNFNGLANCLDFGVCDLLNHFVRFLLQRDECSQPAQDVGQFAGLLGARRLCRR